MLSVLAAVGSCPFSTHSSSDSYSNDDNDNLNQKKKTNKQKNEQQQIGRFSDLSDRSTEMAGCVGQVFSSCSTATNKHDKNKAIIQPPIRSGQDRLKRDLTLCIIDQNKFFFPAETKRKIKSRIAHSSHQSAEHGICFILLTKM